MIAQPPFDRANHCRQIGTLGGTKTAQTYGTTYMRTLGAAGFTAYADAHHDGNRAAARAALMARKPLSFHGQGAARREAAAREWEAASRALLAQIAANRAPAQEGASA